MALHTDMLFQNAQDREKKKNKNKKTQHLDRQELPVFQKGHTLQLISPLARTNPKTPLNYMENSRRDREQKFLQATLRLIPDPSE